MYPITFTGKAPWPPGVFVQTKGKLGAFLEVTFMFASSTGPETLQQNDQIIRLPNGELHVKASV